MEVTRVSELPPDATTDVVMQCPLCKSPRPHLHPAVQTGGEVEICPHEFHLAPTPENAIAYRKAVMQKRIRLGAPIMGLGEEDFKEPQLKRAKVFASRKVRARTFTKAPKSAT